MLFAGDLLSLELDLVALGGERRYRIERSFEAAQADSCFDHLTAALGDENPLVGLAVDPEGRGEVVGLQDCYLEDHDDRNWDHDRVDCGVYY